MLLLLFCKPVSKMSERAIYERLRRRTLSDERRRFRVLSPWLKRVYPEVLSEFNAFYTCLDQSNPRSRNLATTNDFRRFMRLERGMRNCVFFCCFFLFFFSVAVVVVVKCLCYVFRLSYRETDTR